MTPRGRAAESNAPASPPLPPPAARTAAEESADAQRILRSYLQLQEQLHATLLAVEQSRLDTALAAKTNADHLAGRLDHIEQSLVTQRDEQVRAAADSNKTLLLLAGLFVGVGFITLLFMALFQLRGMNRLAEIATGLPAGRALGPGQAPLLLDNGSSDLERARLQGVIERLEKRIEEIEITAAPPSAARGNGHNPQEAVAAHGPAPSPQTATLLAKGQTLLNLGQAADALGCFDQAVARDPHHADAHIKRGLALERLKKPDQALEAYDHAIALDRSLTLAYLCKGSLFNQQERYGEALDCYEQALRSESKL